MSEAIRKTIVVETSQARAFKVFTERLDRWWPREYKIGATAMKRAVMETKSGGRWYEIGEDGAECNWGRVVAYEPPARVLLTWQINAQWQADEKVLTELEVKFIAEGEKRTRVELEHRHLERLGPGAEEIKKTFDSEFGWAGILERFKAETANAEQV
jgi:uncharacterized protein YndB with AHSA1/START domain